MQGRHGQPGQLGQAHYVVAEHHPSNGGHHSHGHHIVGEAPLVLSQAPRARHGAALVSRFCSSGGCVDWWGLCRWSLGVAAPARAQHSLAFGRPLGCARRPVHTQSSCASQESCPEPSWRSAATLRDPRGRAAEGRKARGRQGAGGSFHSMVVRAGHLPPALPFSSACFRRLSS